MNIFYLDTDAKTCAQYHHDVHLRKMIVEYAQLLSTAHHELGVNSNIVNDIYKPTHKNHPCAQWTRMHLNHYEFVFNLFSSCIDEFEFRFNKEHKTKKLTPYLLLPPEQLFSSPFRSTKPPLCMPDQYKTDDPVESYRNFYNAEKQFDKNGKFMANYTNRQPPDWIAS